MPDKKASNSELLARLDERTTNTYHLVEKIEGHMAKQNGRIRKLEISLGSLISLLVGLGVLDAAVFHMVIGG